MEFDVGEPRVVVDDDVQVVVAEVVVLGILVVRARAIAADAMARAVEARQLLDVHVQQGPGPRPLIAAIGLALTARTA